MAYLEATLTANEVSDYFTAAGSCDLLISGLTTGVVNLEVAFRGQTNPIVVPGGSFSEDVWKTLFISEDQVKVRLRGVDNNTVYVRMGRFLNGE